MITNTLISSAKILSLIFNGTAQSKTELAIQTGFSRATVSKYLEPLFATGIIYESEDTIQSGGRPAKAINFNKNLKVILAADIGEQYIRIAVTNMRTEILTDCIEQINVTSGPKVILDLISNRFIFLLDKIGRSLNDVIGIGLSLPAPVDYKAGRVVGPSIMTGWDGFDIRSYLQKKFKTTIVADNDVNIMTVAEQRQYWPNVEQMLFIKLGTGIGCGIVTNRKIYRGAQGAAGDIGHIRLGGMGDPLCRCGNIGCTEALAAGWALARDLRKAGYSAQNARDVLALVKQNIPEAIHMVRKAGKILGEVISDSVSILNPSVVVIGGTLAHAEEYLLAGIREIVYQRALPLATRELIITTSKSGEQICIQGCALSVLDICFLSPAIETTITHLQNLS